MTPVAIPAGYERVRLVRSFDELVTTRFGGGVNALCWPRVLEGDFGEVVRLLGPGEGIITLDEDALRRLPLSGAGQAAVDWMVRDLALLESRDLAPVLNCIHAYPRDENPAPIPTHVMSFHVDSATVEADTYLCTYHGACSEGLSNEDAVRHVDVPQTRADLLRAYGGEDDEGFVDYLGEHCYDLHYAVRPGAKRFAFGTGHLWRIATQYPGSPVPPCIHRAPDTRPGDPPRLLLIS